MSKRIRGVGAAALAGMSLLAAGGAIYSTQIEPGRMQVNPLTLRPRRLPPTFAGFTLAHISDFHTGAWMNRERLARVVDAVNAIAADVVVITGDFIDDECIYPGIYDDVQAELSRLSAREGVFGVLGNHDHWGDPVRLNQTLAAAGVVMLTNKHHVFRSGTDALYLAGVDDVYEKLHDLDAALTGVPDDACVLLLAHESDVADSIAADGRVDVQLSGHSHGGQVRLPLIGAIVTPPLGRKYVMGHYDVRGLQLYVNRGVGMSPLGVRFNCPPEITHITLQTRDAAAY